MRRVLALIVGILALAPAAAMAGSIVASVDKTKIGVGDSALLTVEVRGNIESNPSLSEPPGLSIRFVSQAQHSSLSRGRTSTVTTFRYAVTGTTEGKALIGPVRAVIDGQNKASGTIEIEIVQGRSSSRTGRSSRGGTDQVRGAAPAGQRGGEYFAVASATDRRPYVGESFVYEVEMGSFLNTVGSISWEQPSLPPFSIEPGMELSQDDRQEIIDGRRYTVNTISLPLFAVEAGRAELEPATFKMNILRSGRRRRGSAQAVSFASNPVRVNVRPLPTAGRPDDFDGTVGRYRIEASLDADKLQTGETATLTVRLIGIGALRGRELDVELPDSIRVYDEEPVRRTRLSEDGVRSEITYRKALVPLQPGTIAIPAIEFGYFDPTEDRYRTAKSRPMQLQVDGDPIVDSAIVARSPSLTIAKEQIEVLGDILPLHTGSRMLGDRRPTVASPFLVALLLLPLLGFGGVAARAGRQRFAGTSGGVRRAHRKAARDARGAARRAAKQDDVSGAEQALRDYLTARLRRSGAALSPSDGPAVLSAAGAPEDLADQLGSLLANLEAARFGGVRMGGLADTISKWITVAEEEWK